MRRSAGLAVWVCLVLVSVGCDETAVSADAPDAASPPVDVGVDASRADAIGDAGPPGDCVPGEESTCWGAAVVACRPDGTFGDLLSVCEGDTRCVDGTRGARGRRVAHCLGEAVCDTPLTYCDLVDGHHELWRCDDKGRARVRRCPDGCRDGACLERCNGADDDDDGRSDEGFPGLGEACHAGVGGCERAGRWTCAADGAALSCDAVAGAPAPEACDGTDEDCDGRVDEGACADPAGCDPRASPLQLGPAIALGGEVPGERPAVSATPTGFVATWIGPGDDGGVRQWVVRLDAEGVPEGPPVAVAPPADGWAPRDGSVAQAGAGLVAVTHGARGAALFALDAAGQTTAQAPLSSALGNEGGGKLACQPALCVADAGTDGAIGLAVFGPGLAAVQHRVLDDEGEGWALAASADDGFVVVTRRRGGGPATLRRLGADAALRGQVQPLGVLDAQGLAYGAGRVAVAGKDDAAVWLALYGADDGVEIERTVVGPAAGVSRVRAAWDGHAFHVVWRARVDDGVHLLHRRFDAAGSPLGTARDLTPGAALVGEAFGVAGRDGALVAVSEEDDRVYARRVGPACDEPRCAADPLGFAAACAPGAPCDTDEGADVVSIAEDTYGWDGLLPHGDGLALHFNQAAGRRPTLRALDLTGQRAAADEVYGEGPYHYGLSAAGDGTVQLGCWHGDEGGLQCHRRDAEGAWTLTAQWNARYPAAARVPGGFAVISAVGGWDLALRRLDDAGAVRGEPIIVADVDAYDSGPQVVAGADRLGLLWATYRGAEATGRDIWLRTMAHDGTLPSAPVRLARATQPGSERRVARSGEVLGAVWTTGDGLPIHAQLYGFDGLALGPAVQITEAGGRRAEIVGVDAGFVVLWDAPEADTSRIWGRTLGFDGALGAPQPLPGTRRGRRVRAAWRDGVLAVAWVRDAADGSSEIVGRFVAQHPCPDE